MVAAIFKSKATCMVEQPFLWVCLCHFIAPFQVAHALAYSHPYVGIIIIMIFIICVTIALGSPTHA